MACSGNRYFCAAGATWGECNDRGKPKVPINRVPKRIWGCYFRDTFLGICDRYLNFSCPTHDPGAAPERPDSVCLMSDLARADFFCSHFLERVDGRTTQFSEKSLKKRELEPISVGEAGPFRGHLAEVVALSSSGNCAAAARHTLIGMFGWWRDAVDLHLWRHLPPRVPF